MSQPVDEWSTILIFIACQSLDSATAREWEEKCADLQGDPSIKDFLAFLRSRATLLETIGKGDSKALAISSKPHVARQAHVARSAPSCAICNGGHSVSRCDQFTALTIRERFDKAKALGLCLNCLVPGHMSLRCGAGACRICNRKHHTLLHFTYQPRSAEAREGGNQLMANVACNAMVDQRHILLSTAMVQLVAPDGGTLNARALLDVGSQSNLMTSDFARKFKLQPSTTRVTLIGIGNASSHSFGYCNADVRSLCSGYHTNLNFLVIPQITAPLPSVAIDKALFDIPPHCKLADPSFDKPSEIDILLGAECFYQLLCIGQHALGDCLPILQKTRLGWVVGGPIGQKTASVTRCNMATVELEKSVARFWELDSCLPHADSNTSECERHFYRTFAREANGRFVVRVPYKPFFTGAFGNNFLQARKMLLSQENRFRRDPVLSTKYHEFMKEYEQLGHMTRVGTATWSSGYFIPHHGVFKSCDRQKIRVVFNASAQTDRGHSLNDFQLVGPLIQQDLFSILTRFRKHTYAVTADIKQMYRQINIAKDERKYQRILWRHESSEDIGVYELNTVTYGTGAASFLAVRCVRELANELENTNPAIAARIREDFYVDDFLSGADSVAELRRTMHEVRTHLETGCFDLCKWKSNAGDIIESNDAPSALQEFSDEQYSKTLGLLWSPVKDTFAYRIAPPTPSDKVTKRGVLSTTAQIFDPLGLLAPCIVVAKVILQSLWREKLSWDESLPLSLDTQWRNFRHTLTTLNSIQIPRHVLLSKCTHVELHGFADASEAAYGACLYLKSWNAAGQISCRLLCAKSKVAPTKATSIPRLELCAALLLSRLLGKILPTMGINFRKITLWSDSSVVLTWLRSESTQFKTFVANRVGEIQGETNKVANWRHVPSGDNPADLVSRGTSPHDLMNSHLWWNGPRWLLEAEDSWPNKTFEPSTLLSSEYRGARQIVNLGRVEPFCRLEDYSNLNRAERIVAYALRFIKGLRGQRAANIELTTSEIREAFLAILRMSQIVSFGEVSKGQIIKCHRLAALNPFVDEGGVLRVGGRVRHSPLPYNQKHPAIICGKSHVAVLIVRREHIRLLHAGAQQVLSSIRAYAWITNARNLVKRVIHECVVCFKARPRVFAPIMGDLPRERVTPQLPFVTTGVDYAAPFVIKANKYRNAKTYKAYIALFVCLVTKAIHLELVTSLTAEALIATLRRFAAGRGKPSTVFSDNATNFTGGSREIETLRKIALKDKDLKDYASNQGIEWRFIPPRSPHFGGLWEAGVKSVKFHINRTLRNAPVTYEEFNTVLAQIEAVLNSRPLCPFTPDPDDFSYLTPGHFLVGRPLTAIPDVLGLRDVPECRLSTFERLQKLVQGFWSRWSRDYINQLQQRPKQRSSTSALPPLEGSLALLQEENMPPLLWRLGRIIELHPGRDGVVRVVTLRLANGNTAKRAVTRICVLPTVGC